MNPNIRKVDKKKSAVIGCLCALAVVLAAGTAYGIVKSGADWDPLEYARTFVAGDYEKVSFEQVVKKKNYQAVFSSSSYGFNGTLKDGVYTVDNTGGSANKFFYTGSSYSGQTFIFDKEIHDMSGFGVWYCSYTERSEKVAGSKAGFALGNNTKPTSAVNVWETYSEVRAGSSYSFMFDVPGSYAVPGDVFDVTDITLVNISALGIFVPAEAKAVWEDLTDKGYFEGEKSFTKGEIKKAIADYEDAQAASSSVSSVSSTSSVSSSAA